MYIFFEANAINRVFSSTHFSWEEKWMKRKSCNFTQAYPSLKLNLTCNFTNLFFFVQDTRVCPKKRARMHYAHFARSERIAKDAWDDFRVRNDEVYAESRHDRGFGGG